MKNQTQKKILLALDGSDYAFDMAKYIGKIKAFCNMQVNLFNVFSKVPECFWDMEMQPQNQDELVWEMEQLDTIQRYMEKVKSVLLSSGLSQEAITVKIQKREKGFARDIINEAKSGYNAVMIGRKGLNAYEEIVLGSVAVKVIEKVSFVPVLVIGGKPSTEKILIAMDRSENAMRAVDFVSTMLCSPNAEVMLMHVIRKMNDAELRWQRKFTKKESCESAQEKMEIVFEKAKGRMIESGFQADKITTQIISDAPSRSTAIAQEVIKGDYGTVVMGRRGVSEVTDFAMGRVSNKIIHLVRESAIWVVT